MPRAMDALAKQTDQNRSELVRRAVREYLMDSEEDRDRFVAAYRSTRKEKVYTHAQLKKQLGLS